MRCLSYIRVPTSTHFFQISLFCTVKRFSENLKPQEFLHLLNRCISLKQFNQIQSLITTSGLNQNKILVGKMVEVSAIYLQNINIAMLIFNNSIETNSFTWNTIIRALASSNKPLRAIFVFLRMLFVGIETDSYTFAFVFKACANLRSIEIGNTIHSMVLKSGQGYHSFVATTMLYFYGVCGEVDCAQKVFDSIACRNIVTWNALIACYVQNGMNDIGLCIFSRMWELGFLPDDATVVSVVSACARTKNIELGRWIHCYVSHNRAEFDRNPNVMTALIDMYAKCGNMDLAQQLFEKMPSNDIGVWNALLAGFVHNECYVEALDLFEKLKTEGLNPNEPTLVSSLCACTYSRALDTGKNIHMYIENRDIQLTLTLGTALLDMYSKCGCIEKAREVFDRMRERDIMTWTSMICGLAFHGYAKDALHLFETMQRSAVKPDEITFTGVLSACSHVGLVDEAIRYFINMKNHYGITPKIEHYGCMVDILSRVGRLNEAFDLINRMEIRPNAILWRTLLSACRLYNNIELAEIVAKRLFELQCGNRGDYVLLSNIYASEGRWYDVERIRRQIEEEKLKKIHGFSAIETPVSSLTRSSKYI